MKRFIIFSLILISFTSCDIIYINPGDGREQFLGDYNVEEYSTTFRAWTNYPIHITRSASYDEIYLNNFYDADLCIYARIHGDQITIPFQVVNGYEVEGSGYLTGRRLEMTYRVLDRYQYRAISDFCETTAYADF